MSSCEISNSLPLVSVIIPAYNAEKFIERTLKSVLNQTYQNLEILVVDDGSQDHTPNIVRSIALHDDRVTLLKQPNSGVAAARNLGIRYAQGEFIAPIDADDIWHPQNIEKQVHCMLQAKPQVGLVYSWSVDIDEKDVPQKRIRASRIEGNVYLTLLLHDFVANASCVLIRRACFEKIGSYNINLKKQNGQGGEDWDIYLRIAEHYQFRVVPELLVGYRRLANSMSSDCAQMAKSRHLIWKFIRKSYPAIPVLLERLSNSSFYMNLAKISSQNGRLKTALVWMGRALKEGYFTPLLRLDLYLLLIQFIPRVIPEFLKPRRNSACVSELNLLEKLFFNDRKACSVNLTRRENNKNLKTFGESLLHQLAPILFGTPKNWQAKSTEKFFN